ncbi:uncharacterized protein LOC111815157 isoform X1 [Octodon degus]|uniref:Uncharacterized protein LOC111815157 isoform X1 n=1 Tax=Octodon degus TaxID=10160 RepID=A0A6P6DYV9_OCTDE|nr:uncharacterized protein LOC111815157 isoform X1 [Octodon degus]
MLCKALVLCSLCVLAEALPLPDLAPLDLVTYLPELASIINELHPGIDVTRHKDLTAGVAQTSGPDLPGGIFQDTQTFNPLVNHDPTVGDVLTSGLESTKNIFQEDTQTANPLVNQDPTVGDVLTSGLESTRNIFQEDTQTANPLVNQDPTVGDVQTSGLESTGSILQEDTQTAKFPTALVLDVSPFDSVEETNEAAEKETTSTANGATYLLSSSY